MLSTWQLCSRSWCWVCSWSRATRRRCFSSGGTVESGCSNKARVVCVICRSCACWIWSCWSSACKNKSIYVNRLSCLNQHLLNRTKILTCRVSVCKATASSVGKLAASAKSPAPDLSPVRSGWFKEANSFSREFIWLCVSWSSSSAFAFKKND